MLQILTNDAIFESDIFLCLERSGVTNPNNLYFVLYDWTHTIAGLQVLWTRIARRLFLRFEGIDHKQVVYIRSTSPQSRIEPPSCLSSEDFYLCVRRRQRLSRQHFRLSRGHLRSCAIQPAWLLEHRIPRWP